MIPTASPDLHLGTEGQVSAVTHLAHPVAGPAGEDGANLHFLDAGIHDASSDVLVDHLVPLDDHFSGLRVANGLEGDPADDPVVKLLDHFALVFDPADGKPFVGAAILFPDDHVLGHVHEAAGEVTRVRRPERRIRQTFPGAVGGDEVLQHGQSLRGSWT